MKIYPILRLISLALPCLAAGCAGYQPGEPTAVSITLMITPTVPVQATATPPSGELSNLIGDILVDPSRNAGRTVEITGYFRGWDLLKEAQGGPPITRSDWVIADQGGAIYVTGAFPEDLDPASPESAWALVRLKATVASVENQVYLKAQSVERLD